MSKQISKKMYEEHLNENAPPAGSMHWIIGGKIRLFHMSLGDYGTAIRKYDPIGFEAGYREWKSEQLNNQFY